jgi:glutamine synthetase
VHDRHRRIATRGLALTARGLGQLAQRLDGRLQRMLLARRQREFLTRRGDGRGFVDQFGWLDKMATAINGLGWDLYSFDHEDGNGQFEFDFAYSDALRMCDRMTFFRFMAKHYAKEEGLLATMMPKPFGNRTGTGAHFNMSLYDLKTKANLFACHPKDDPRGLGLTPMGYQFIGGILKHGRALCAAFAPTVNSYKRLNARGTTSGATWAPNAITWGGNNRTHMIRIPEGGRFECRLADGAANPYLLQAAVLAAGLDGIERRLDPGPRSDANTYTDPPAPGTAQPLPASLEEALEAFAADTILQAALGTEFCSAYQELVARHPARGGSRHSA